MRVARCAAAGDNRLVHTQGERTRRFFPAANNTFVERLIRQFMADLACATARPPPPQSRSSIALRFLSTHFRRRRLRFTYLSGPIAIVYYG